MPIPGFTIDGILPPFVGPNGPGGTPEDLSPYAVTAIEVVTTLALTDDRKKILRLPLRCTCPKHSGTGMPSTPSDGNA